ncbi:MAG TPA: hypothetical protein VL418_03480 [Devosiaceae bacterium]|nr:hypothetical protein [Devosiaceae bacterium]
MTLQRLARELDETARQTAALVDGIAEALTVLSNGEADADEARTQAAAMIVTALQGQDRIEQRCRNLAQAVSEFAKLTPAAPDAAYDAIWAKLTLDELRLPSLSGIAANSNGAEIELF